MMNNYYLRLDCGYCQALCVWIPVSFRGSWRSHRAPSWPAHRPQKTIARFYLFRAMLVSFQYCTCVFLTILLFRYIQAVRRVLCISVFLDLVFAVFASRVIACVMFLVPRLESFGFPELLSVIECSRKQAFCFMTYVVSFISSIRPSLFFWFLEVCCIRVVFRPNFGLFGALLSVKAKSQASFSQRESCFHTFNKRQIICNDFLFLVSLSPMSFLCMRVVFGVFGPWGGLLQVRHIDLRGKDHQIFGLWLFLSRFLLFPAEISVLYDSVRTF